MLVGNVRPVAVSVDISDHAVLSVFVGIRTPWLTSTARGRVLSNPAPLGMLAQMMRQQGRDLHAEFVALLPERPHPVRIQRWTLRRVALIVGLVIAAVPLTVIVYGVLAPI